jgi:hypothetical protein
MLAIETFVHQQNLLHLQRKLAEAPDEKRRLKLLMLLAEEEAKNPKPAKEK